jgi:hypothetical protein
MYAIQFLPIDELNDEDSEKFDKDNLNDNELDHCWMDWSSGYDSWQDVAGGLVEMINSEEVDMANSFYRIKEY